MTANFLKPNMIKPVQGIKPVAPKATQQVPPIVPKAAPVVPGVKPISPIAPKAMPKAPAKQTEENTTETTTVVAPKPMVAPKIVTENKIKDIVNKPEEVVEEKVTDEVTEATEENTKEQVKEVSETVEKAKEIKEEETVKETKEKETKNNEEKQVTTKTTRKSSRSSKSTKQEVENEEFIPELMPKRCERDYNEVISETVIYSAGEEWEMQCKEIDEQLRAIQITPDMNAATMKQATAELSQLRDMLYLEANTAKTIMESIESKITIVKQLNAKGSSPDERKLNSIKACMYHKVDDMTVNLFELEDVARAKHNFYESVMKQIEYKSKALITMNGGLKLEKDIMGA